MNEGESSSARYEDQCAGDVTKDGFRSRGCSRDEMEYDTVFPAHFSSAPCGDLWSSENPGLSGIHPNPCGDEEEAVTNAVPHHDTPPIEHHRKYMGRPGKGGAGPLPSSPMQAWSHQRRPPSTRCYVPQSVRGGIMNASLLKQGSTTTITSDASTIVPASAWRRIITDGFRCPHQAHHEGPGHYRLECACYWSADIEWEGPETSSPSSSRSKSRAKAKRKDRKKKSASKLGHCVTMEMGDASTSTCGSR